MRSAFFAVMASGAVPVSSANADAPHPSRDLADPAKRNGLKQDAANFEKSTRRPL
jgi:hypothetical protein